MTPDIAYANADFIEGAAEYPGRWAKNASAFRASMAAAGRSRENIAYGSGPRQVMDLFLPDNAVRGLAVFFHGGYWRAFGKEDWSHLAAGAVARGWAVAMPSYTLAPTARIAEITQEAARAVEKAAGIVPGPIVLTGHSAGGHLVARLNCTDVVLDGAVSDRLKRILPISPVADLRPLLQTAMNADFRLDKQEATTESPLLHSDRRRIETHVWVGAEERPAFLDQARWLEGGWDEAALHIAPGRHHFDVIEALEQPDSTMLNSLLAA